MKCEAKWNGKMSFQSHIREHVLMMDAKREHGGENLGPTPKEMVLTGLAGCTAMDVASLLKKFREPVTEFSVFAESTQTQDHPVVFKDIHLVFEVKGSSEMNPGQVIKAVELSMNRYCGVSAMLSKAAPVFYRILLNGQEIGSGKAFASSAT